MVERLLPLRFRARLDDGNEKRLGSRHCFNLWDTNACHVFIMEIPEDVTFIPFWDAWWCLPSGNLT
jgi:hypothetical protein